MNDEKVPASNVFVEAGDRPAAMLSRRSWWKPYRRTWTILLTAVGSIVFLGVLVFGGRDTSGDAAGQGLAGGFKAMFFFLGVFLIVSVALIMWLSRYVGIAKIIMGIFGLVALAVIAFSW
jgi:hypothetical protein